MDIQAILAGVGAIATGAGGVAIVVREFRRADRKELKETVAEMTADQRMLTTDLLACRRYVFTLQQTLAEHGLEHPTPPVLGRPPEEEP